MAMIKLTPMSGMIPRTGQRLLPDAFAISATNVKIQSGELRPLRQPGLLYVPEAPKTLPPLAIFKARNGVAETAWFTWPFDADVVRAPFAVDVESRFYWTGDGEPRFAPYTLAITGGGNDYPNSYYALGIPTPTTAVSVSHAGGTGTATTRFYRYTFVSQHGEESGPSPVSAEVTGKVDGTWSIGSTTAMQAFPISSGTYAGVYGAGVTVCTAAATHWLRVGDEVVINSVDLIVSAVSGLTFTVAGDYSVPTTWARKAAWNTSGMYRRLYRTTGTGGSYQLVADNIATTTYSDTLTDAQIEGDDMISEGWEPPPTGLTCLCTHPSGALLALVGNLLCMSEPYQPHAWPISYQLGADYDGVGLAVFGSTVVMATAGNPFIVTGVEPASMSGESGKGMYPCLSKRSVISIGSGVLYASKHGAVLVGSGGVSMFTEPFYTRDEWELLNPETMIFETANGRVYIAYTDDDALISMLVIDGPVLVQVGVQATELYADVSTGELYIGSSAGISLWDAPTAVVLQGNWQSKVFVFPTPINIGAGKVEFDPAIDAAVAAALAAYIASIAVSNAALLPSPVSNPLTVVLADALGGGYNDDDYNEQYIDGCALVEPPENPPSNVVTVTLFSEGAIVATRNITDTKAFRFPAGYKKDNFSVQVTSQCTVKEIRLSETSDGLRVA